MYAKPNILIKCRFIVGIHVIISHHSARIQLVQALFPYIAKLLRASYEHTVEACCLDILKLPFKKRYRPVPENIRHCHIDFYFPIIG